MPKATLVTFETQPSVQGPIWQIGLKLRQEISQLLRQRQALLCLICGFLLGRVFIMGEINPFAPAFFAVVALRSRTLAIMTGAAILSGILSVGQFQSMAIQGLTMLLYGHLMNRLSGIERKLLLYPFLLFVSLLLCNFLVVVWQAITLYHLLLMVVQALLTGFTFYLFRYGTVYFFPVVAEKREEHVAGLLFLIAVALAGVGSWQFYDLSLHSVLGGLATVLMAFAGGPGLGSAMGVAVGLVMGLNQGQVALEIAHYATAGLLAGLFFQLGRYGAALGYLIGSSMMLLYFEQAGSVAHWLMEAALASSLLFLVPVSWTSSLREQVLLGKSHEDKEVLQAAAQKMAQLEEMFQDLSETFTQVGEAGRKGRKEQSLSLHLRAIGEGLCHTCEKRPYCWDEEGPSTYEALVELLTTQDAMQVTVNNLPKVLRERCHRKIDMVAKIRKTAEEQQVLFFWEKKVANTRLMVVEQVKALSHILRNLRSEFMTKPEGDAFLAKQIQDKAALLHCPLQDVKLTGTAKGKRSLVCNRPTCANTEDCEHTVLPLVNEWLGETFLLKKQCHYEKGLCQFTLESKAVFEVETAAAALPKDGGTLSGDTVSVTRLPGGKVALLLSDGMGSGREAALESNMAVRFLERLLKEGFSVEAAVSTVNSLLLVKQRDESFATVDMVLIDSCTGEAEFLKIGSAPSYIKRVKEVTSIQSSSVPMGIFEQVDLKPIRIQLAAEDLIVLISDGVLDASRRSLEREDWVTTSLRQMNLREPRKIANELLAQARRRTGQLIIDDLTVLVAKLVKSGK